MKRPLFAFLLSFSLFYLTPVSAQSEYPNKPVRLVVSFPAGGISDVGARARAHPQ
jgi:tripartite-type tricarboxylate transporter receptor subunit TctC